MYFQGDDVRLICPNCATQYEVADADIPVAGRIVQCGICENEWTATRPRIAEPTPVDEPALSEAFPAVAVPSEIASAIADALGDQRDMQSPVDAPEDEVYATDDRLSMDLDEDESDDESANASDFDAEALRSLLSRQMSDRPEPPQVEDTVADDFNDLMANVMDAVGTEPAAPEIAQDDLAEEPHEAAPEAGIVPETRVEEPDAADFSIPPVPRNDAIRASADAAFEAMRARRAERRAARDAGAPTPEPIHLVEEPAAEVDEADAVLNDLRRILDEPEQQAATLTHDTTSAPEAATLDIPPAPSVEPAPLPTRPQRPARPGRPSAEPTFAAVHSAEVSADEVADTPQPKSGGRGGLGFFTAILMALVAASVYFLAADIAAALPAVAPALDTYVTTIDSLRAAIVAQVNSF